MGSRSSPHICEDNIYEWEPLGTGARTDVTASTCLSSPATPLALPLPSKKESYYDQNIFDAGGTQRRANAEISSLL